MEFRSVYFVVKDEQQAKLLSQVLVGEKLIACANYFRIRSVYRWQGKVEEAEEVGVIAKTRSDLVDSLIERIKELHSYEVPCVVSWIIEKGNPDYLDWIKESTQTGEK